METATDRHMDNGSDKRLTTEWILEENRRRNREMERLELSDFADWAERNVLIKPKGGGAALPFRLNRPQRRLVAALDAMRLSGKPIRLILLKARQWGGSALYHLLIYFKYAGCQYVSTVLINLNKKRDCIYFDTTSLIKFS